MNKNRIIGFGLIIVAVILFFIDKNEILNLPIALGFVWGLYMIILNKNILNRK